MTFIRRLKDKEKLKINKKFSAFLVCLAVAGIFWFLIALSKNYNALISLPVVYQNLPEDKILTRKLPETISLELNAQGFHLLAYQLKFFNDSIIINADNLDIKKTESFYEAKLSTSSKLHRISRQFSTDVMLNRILPDTIHFTFGNKKSKETPVNLKYLISYEKQFRLKDRIIFTPSKIKVKGLDKLVDAIDFFDTDSLILENLNSTVTKEVPLKIPENYSLLELSAKSVHVTIPVEKYTEAYVEIPIEVANLPDDLSIKVFPDKIKVYYVVGFDDFNKVNEQMFTAKVDYLKKDNTNRLAVEVSRHPDFVSIIKKQPSKVEYLILKK